MNVHTIKLLNMLKNASMSNKEVLVLPENKSIGGVICLLYQEGFIRSFKKKNGLFFIFLSLNYNKNSLKDLKIFSKPSSIAYLKFSEISKITSKKKVFFFSTDQGILTDLECKKKRIGGTLFFVC